MNNKQFWVTAILSSPTMATIMSGLISGYKWDSIRMAANLDAELFHRLALCHRAQPNRAPLIRKNYQHGFVAWRTLCVPEITERWSGAYVQGAMIQKLPSRGRDQRVMLTDKRLNCFHKTTLGRHLYSTFTHKSKAINYRLILQLSVVVNLLNVITVVKRLRTWTSQNLLQLLARSCLRNESDPPQRLELGLWERSVQCCLRFEELSRWSEYSDNTVF